VIEIAGAGLTSALVAYLIGRIEPGQPAPPPAVVHLAPSDEQMIRAVHSDQAALLDQLRNAEARKTQATTSQAASQATPPATSEAASQASPPAELQATAQMTPQATAQVAPPAAVVEVAVSATDLAIASAPVPKPDKSAQAPMRRDQKSERVRVVDAKADLNKADVKPRPKVEPRVAPRAEELTQGRPMPGVVVDAVARNAAQRDVVAAPTSAPPLVAPPPVASAPPPESDGVLSSTLRGITAWILPSRDRMPMPDQNATRPPKAVGEFQQSSM
jgi:hypothetical protein